MGPLLTEAFSPACHSASPVVASSATMSFDGPPAKRRLPAVLSRPYRALPSQTWLQRTLPVL
jgi:hypothetical protein